MFGVVSFTMLLSAWNIFCYVLQRFVVNVGRLGIFKLCREAQEQNCTKQVCNT